MCDFNIEFDEEKVFERNSCIEFKSKRGIELLESWLDKQGINYNTSLSKFYTEKYCCYRFSVYGFNRCHKQWYIDNGYKIYQVEDVILILNNKNNKKEIKKEMHNTIEKYEFRGEFNVDLICNDLFRSMKRSAVIIGKENALVILAQNYVDDVDDICWEVIYDNNNFKEFKSSDEHDIIYPYFFKIISKKDANNWIQTLRDENKRYNKMILKMKDKNTKLMKQGKNKKDHFRVFML